MKFKLKASDFNSQAAISGNAVCIHSSLHPLQTSKIAIKHSVKGIGRPFAGAGNVQEGGVWWTGWVKRGYRGGMGHSLLKVK